jgi:arginyl-tRNA synthetase
MVQEFKEKGVAVESDGATCIFVGKKNSPPVIVQKSDGGFGYAATDLAAIRYRVNEINPERIIYVTDIG